MLLSLVEATINVRNVLHSYKQALHTAVQGRSLVEAAGVAFNRPSDFYAEQVKSDEHMERVRQRLLDESAGIKASEEAKRQRELKKFGKKVQVERQLERQKSKKDLQERVKGLKRSESQCMSLCRERLEADLFCCCTFQSMETSIRAQQGMMTLTCDWKQPLQARVKLRLRAAVTAHAEDVADAAEDVRRCRVQHARKSTALAERSDVGPSRIRAKVPTTLDLARRAAGVAEVVEELEVAADLLEVEAAHPEVAPSDLERNVELLEELSIGRLCFQ